MDEMDERYLRSLQKINDALAETIKRLSAIEDGPGADRHFGRSPEGERDFMISVLQRISTGAPGIE